MPSRTLPGGRRGPFQVRGSPEWGPRPNPWCGTRVKASGYFGLLSGIHRRPSGVYGMTSTSFQKAMWSLMAVAAREGSG